MTVKRVEIPAVDGTYPVEIPANGNTTLVFSKPASGTATAGTVAIQASAPGDNVFSAITGISDIDIAAPIPQTIQGTPADRLELTLSGFAGTADHLYFTATTWD